MHVVSFIAFYTYFLNAGDVQISVTYGKEPSHQCLHVNDDVTLTCQVNPLENVVEWLHGSTRMVTCSNHRDNTCLPYGGEDTFPRHTFSSDVSNKQFTLHIDSLIPDTDAGVYVCEHGGYTESASVTLDACGKFLWHFTHMSLMQVMYRTAYHVDRNHLSSVFMIIMMSHLSAQ